MFGLSGTLLGPSGGLESLKSLPGFDEKTARYIQQALSVTPHTPRLDGPFAPLGALWRSKDVEGMAVEEPRIVFPPEEQRRMVADDWKLLDGMDPSGMNRDRLKQAGNEVQ